MSIAVLLVDDNALFRDGLAQILRADGRFEVVGQASRGEEAIAIAAELRPDLILMDLHMPGMSGVTAIPHLLADNPHVPIGVLTMFETQEYVQAALDAGASGYLAKDSTPADVCEAAVALAHGKRDLVAIPYSDRSARPASASPVLAALTERELEVLRALTTRASNEAIAKTLGISPKTLRNHLSNTYRKLRVHDRAQAVLIAVRERLVELDAS
jgi:DNA-binding NarL/FixJ family response regulator